MNWQWFHRLGSPRWFYEKTSVWLPWLTFFTLVLLLVGSVWGCYGIGLLVVAYLLISPVHQKKKFMRQLRSQYARQAASGRVDSAP